MNFTLTRRGIFFSQLTGKKVRLKVEFAGCRRKECSSMCLYVIQVVFFYSLVLRF